MTRILLVIFFTAFYANLFSQNLSYTCPRDTILGCNTTCLTINSKFPDIKSSTSDYTIKNVSTDFTCWPYAPSTFVGPTTSLIIDDTYSTSIPIGFNFPFYGITYTNLVASTNGYLSFNTALAGAYSAWSLTNGNVPNATYDGALIMGPWHDLDPAYTTSPIPQAEQIKYNTVGTAPNRKWVLSFNRVPLFSTTCAGQYENSHQIILHESTGLVEVVINDKQICASWNSGRAMVGLQDMSKTVAIMAPGRAALDPPWGSIGMNEVWRFYPSAGPTLYRSVQLLDAAGTVVATGDTTRIDANTFQTTFPNICPSATGNSIYVVKTTYQKIDDPTSTIFSLDTINVLRQSALPVTATMTPTTCGASTGSITVNAAGTPGYQYTLDGGAIQTTPVFTGVSVGLHTIFAQDATGCNNTTTITVTAVSSLPNTMTSANCTCPGRNDGTISVMPTLGTAPFTFTITGTSAVPPPVTNNGPAVFSSLSAGTYTVTFTDALGCTGTTAAIVITAGTSIFSTSSSTSSCPSVSNGTATITPTTGTGPYTFSLPGYLGTPPPSGSSALYTGLAGLGFWTPYPVTVTDATGCTGLTNVYVYAGTGITGNATSTQTSCTGVNNGTMTATPTSGTGPFTFSFDGSAFVPTNTPPSMTFPGVTSGSHTITIMDVTGCTGTVTSTIFAGPGIAGNATSTATSCPQVSNGTISVTTSNGTSPFTYSLDGGAYQSAASMTATFINIATGAHNIIVRDALGCTGTFSTTILPGAGLIGTVSSTPTSCPGVFNGTITVTPTNGTSPFTYSINGGAFQPSPNPGFYTFNNIASGAHVIIIKDAINCEGTVYAVVGVGAGLTAGTTNTNPPCANISDGVITILPSLAGSYTFTLNPGTPLAITQNSPTFTGLSIGSYNYSFTNLSSGCMGSGTTTLTTNTPLTTTVALTMPLCYLGSDGIISLVPSGGVPNYEYSLDAGLTYQTSGVFSTVNGGTHTIRIKDNVGCIKDTTIIMSQPTLLLASATSTPGTCNGSDGQIVVSGSAGTPGYTYSINNGGTYQAGATFIVNGGSYPDIKVKDANGCVSGTSVVVTLIDNMVVTPVRDTTICVEQSVVLIPNFSIEATVFNWRTIPNAALSGTLSSTTIKTPTATPTDTTIYVVKASWGICQREDTIRVNVLHKPIPNAGPGNIICQYASTPLTGFATNTSGPVSFEWTPSSSVHPANVDVTSADPFTTQIYTLTVTDNYGCNFSVSDTVKITVQPPVPAFAGNDTIAVRGQSIQLTASGGPDVVNYLWTPSYYIANPNANSDTIRTINLTDDQMFMVTVTDIGGCIGKDSVFVRVYDGPTYYVPTSFTPNGDGLNDFFRAIPVGIANTEYFRVYNRFGQIVFETNRWLQGWNGSFQGRKQPSGTYIWIVKGIDKYNKPVEQKGTVVLIY